MLLLGFVLDSSYTVEPHEQAVVLRFGKYHATTMPGLHFKLPMIDQVMKVSVEEHGLRLPFGAPSAGENAMPGRRCRQHEDETLMLTGDLNTASVEWTVAVEGHRAVAIPLPLSPRRRRMSSPPTSSPSSPAP